MLGRGLLCILWYCSIYSCPVHADWFVQSLLLKLHTAVSNAHGQTYELPRTTLDIPQVQTQLASAEIHRCVLGSTMHGFYTSGST